MNILQITPSYKPAFIYGGPIFSVAILAEQLSFSNKVVVFTTLANGKQELDFIPNKFQEIDKVKVRFFKRETKDHTHFSFSLFLHLWKDCKNYDIVHIHSWWNAVAVFAALICKVRNVKYLVSPRGMFSEYSMDHSSRFIKTLISLMFNSFLLKKANFHATTQMEAIRIQKLFKEAKIFVAPNFVAIRNNNQITRNGGAVFSLVFLSRLDSKKGIELLINAITELPFKIHLHIIGDGEESYLKRLKKLIQSKGLSNQISWTNGVFSEDKYQLLANADLFVLPSFDENFANVVLESLSVGTPVLISNQVGLSDLVLQYNLGWICEPNVVSLRAQLIVAHADEKKRLAINQNSAQIVSEEFSSDKILKDYLNIYNKVIQNVK